MTWLLSWAFAGLAFLALFVAGLYVENRNLKHKLLMLEMEMGRLEAFAQAQYRIHSVERWKQ